MNRLAVAAAGALLLAGCNWMDRNRPVAARPEVSSDEHAGVRVELRLPKRLYETGEPVDAEIAVTNTTKQPITIVARTGAPVYLNVKRHTDIGWEQVKEYPQAATMVITPWTLEGGQTRRFELSPTIRPDWPTNEPLRVEAEVNGWSKASPAIVVTVERPGRTE